MSQTNDWEFRSTPANARATFIAFNRNDIGHHDALGELIDNAIVARAKSISITFESGSSKSLTVLDDGDGLSDVDKMFCIGEHIDQYEGERTISRYGIGFNAAATYYLGVATVKSIHDGDIHMAKVDWEQATSFGCDYRKPIKFTRDIARAEGFGDSPRGTRIRFSNTKRRFTNLDSLGVKLRYTFMPALQRGIRISINDKRLKPYEPPTLELEETQTVQCSGGKAFTLRAGIVPTGVPNSHPGFSIAYGHRIIKSTSDGILTNSRIRCFQTCRKKHFYSYEIGRV